MRLREFEVIPPCAALIFAEPTLFAVARPDALTVATAELEEDQFTEFVRFCVLPSLNVPVAVNWSVVPFAIDVLGALIVIDCSTAAVTASAIEFDVTPLWAALMLVVPVPAPVTRPDALTVATAELEEDQVTEFVRLCVLPSLNVPVAVNWSVVPLAIEALDALMVIDCSTAAVTVSAIVFDVTPLCAALIVAEPTLFAVAKPDALAVATVEFEEDQLTEVVRFCALPSLNVPVAVN